MFTPNLIAVLLAGLVPMITGFIWYNKIYMALLGVKLQVSPLLCPSLGPMHYSNEKVLNM